jgi:hypothetical protein
MARTALGRHWNSIVFRLVSGRQQTSHPVPMGRIASRNNWLTALD